MPKILMYHALGPVKGWEPGAEHYCISEKQFREQMECVCQLTGSRVNKFRVLKAND